MSFEQRAMQIEVRLTSRPSNLGTVVLDPNCEFLPAETGLSFTVLLSEDGATSPSLLILGPGR